MPINIYKENEINNQSKEELLISTYKGAINFLSRSEMFLEINDFEQVNNHLIRVQDILLNLRNNLNKEVDLELVNNLDALYEYMQNLLMEANLKKSSEKIIMVKNMLQDLLNAWIEASQLLQAN